MKSLATAGFCLLVSSGAAAAADIGTAPAPVVPETWASPFAGFYVGAHVGHAWGNVDVNADSVVGPIFSIDVANGTLASREEYSPSGFMGGVTVGYDAWLDPVVLGVVADIDWSDVEGSTTYSALDLFLFPGAVTNTVFASELDWFGTVRGRVGVPYGSTLFYATGGLAFGEVENYIAVTIPSVAYAPAPWVESEVQTGWTIGAGIEHAFTERFSIEVEYLHYDLGDSVIRAADNVTFPGQYIDYSFDNSGDVVRVGINVRL